MVGSPQRSRERGREREPNEKPKPHFSTAFETLIKTNPPLVACSEVKHNETKILTHPQDSQEPEPNSTIETL